MAVPLGPGLAASAIHVAGLTKSFGATRVLDGVSLDVKRGSIHALIGLNGSGKSTLVKVLSGFHKADAGEISMGEVAFVHQDLALLSTMTVLENFAIGRTIAMRHGQIDWKTEERRAAEALRDFGLGHLIHRQLSDLSQAEQTVIAIARALDRSSDGQVAALILDEPTSALPHREVTLLASVMKQYAGQGVGILFITHRLQEVKDIADELTILRNGHVAFTGDVGQLTVAQMAAQMVGDASDESAEAYRAPAPGPVVLEASSVRGGTVRDFSLAARSGEVIGIFGMNGSGIEAVGGMLAGRRSIDRGDIYFEGQPLRPGTKRVRDIGYVPSERPRKGIFPGLTVRENISVRTLQSLTRRGGLSRRSERSVVKGIISKLLIKTESAEVPISALSGGNQQKAVLGRWLTVQPRAIVAEEPTQGIDVWAKREVLHQLRLAAASGASVILTAVEPGEILTFCDRVLVLKGGTVDLDAPRGDLSAADILSAMH